MLTLWCDVGRCSLTVLVMKLLLTSDSDLQVIIYKLSYHSMMMLSNALLLCKNQQSYSLSL